MSDYLQPHGQWPTRLLCPRDFPGKHSEECSNFLLRGSSQPRDQTFVSSLAGRFFTTEPPGKPTYQDCCSVTQSYLTVWDPMVCSMPGFPVLQYFPELLKLMSIESRCHPTVSSSVVPFFSCLPSFPTSGSFPMSPLFTSGGQSFELQLQP